MGMAAWLADRWAGRVKFRLGTIAYVFALLAAFGNWGGIFAAGGVAGFWAWAAHHRWENVKAPAVGLALLLVAAALLDGAISAAREAASRSSCQGRMAN